MSSGKRCALGLTCVWLRSDTGWRDGGFICLEGRGGRAETRDMRVSEGERWGRMPGSTFGPYSDVCTTLSERSGWLGHTACLPRGLSQPPAGETSPHAGAMVASSPKTSTWARASSRDKKRKESCSEGGEVDDEGCRRLCAGTTARRPLG